MIIAVDLEVSMQGKIWAKLIKKTKIIKQSTQDGSRDSVQDAMYQICKDFDISQPMWSNKNQRDWENHSMTKFIKDDFIDEFPYDLLEINYLFEEK